MTKKKSLFSLYFTIFNDCISWGIVLTIFAPMLLDIDFPMLPRTTSIPNRMILIGVLLSVFGLGQFFFSPIIGALSDHIGRRRVLISTLFISTIANFLSALSIYNYSYIILLVSRLIAGCASGNLPLAQASIGDLSSDSTRTKNMAKIGMIAGISWIVGPPLGGILANPHFFSLFNFAMPMWLLTLLFIGNMIAVYIGFKETYIKKRKEGHGIKEELMALKICYQNKKLRYPIFILFLYLLGWFFYQQFYPTILALKFQYTQSGIGFFSAFLAVWFLLGSLAASYYFSSRVAPKKMIIPGLLISGISILAISGFENPYLYLISFAFAGVGSAFAWINFMSYLSKAAGEKNQGKVFGVEQSLTSVGLFLGPLLSGFMSGKEVMMPIIIGGIILILGAILYYILIPKE